MLINLIINSDLKKFNEKIKNKIIFEKQNGNLIEEDNIIEDLEQHQNSLKNKKVSFLKKTNKFIFFPFKNFRTDMFITTIKVGSNSQELKVIFDTGSSDIWLNSNLCKSLNCQLNKFNKDESQTFKEENLIQKIAIGDGYLKGKLGSDTIKLNNIILKNQEFFNIEQISSNMLYGFDGIIGLGFKNLSHNNVQTFLEGIKKTKQIKKNNFLLDYKNKNIEFGSEIEYDNKFENSVIGDKYWKIKIDDVKINGESMNFCQNDCYGIIDTGSSLISGPSDNIYKLIQKLNINLDCSNLNSLPPISFVINGEEYVLEYENYIISKKSDNDSLMKCLGSFSAIEIPNNEKTWVLGNIFLSNFKSLFDFENLKVILINK